MTLVEFLTARLDEDERIAREAKREMSPGGYLIKSMCVHLPPEVQEHNARHDPARVLREVEAKRAILGELADDTWDRLYLAGLEAAVRLLAAAYADHPDYDESWRP